MMFFAATLSAMLGASSAAPLAPMDFAGTRHDYPPEAAVTYQRPFVEAHSELVCASLNDSGAPWSGYRRVTSAAGARYLLSPPVGGGSFGAFRYALDANGQTWGVKEFSNQAFIPTQESSLRREWGLWEHLGRDVTVRDVLRDEEANSTLVVMTLLDGDVANLAFRLEPDQRAVLARGMLKQVAGDATELHSLGFVHHDVRTPNIFWDRSGRIILADYGIAQHVEADGYLERAPWAVVLGQQVGVGVAEMVAAPEVLASRYTARSDMWSLGLAALMTLVPDDPLVGSLVQEMRINTDGYASWRRTLLNARGEVDLACIVDPSMQSVPARHYVFQAVFEAAKAVDPALTQRILQHLLVPNPALRWSAEQLVQAAAQEAPSEADLAPLLQAAALQQSNPEAAASLLGRCAEDLEPALLCDASNPL